MKSAAVKKGKRKRYFVKYGSRLFLNRIRKWSKRNVLRKYVDHLFHRVNHCHNIAPNDEEIAFLFLQNVFKSRKQNNAEEISASVQKMLRLMMVKMEKEINVSGLRAYKFGESFGKTDVDKNSSQVCKIGNTGNDVSVKHGLSISSTSGESTDSNDVSVTCESIDSGASWESANSNDISIECEPCNSSASEESTNSNYITIECEPCNSSASEESANSSYITIECEPCNSSASNRSVENADSIIELAINNDKGAGIPDSSEPVTRSETPPHSDDQIKRDISANECVVKSDIRAVDSCNSSSEVVDGLSDNGILNTTSMKTMVASTSVPVKVSDVAFKPTFNGAKPPKPELTLNIEEDSLNITWNVVSDANTSPVRRFYIFATKQEIMTFPFEFEWEQLIDNGLKPKVLPATVQVSVPPYEEIYWFFIRATDEYGNYTDSDIMSVVRTLNMPP